MWRNRNPLWSNDAIDNALNITGKKITKTLSSIREEYMVLLLKYILYIIPVCYFLSVKAKQEPVSDFSSVSVCKLVCIWWSLCQVHIFKHAASENLQYKLNVLMLVISCESLVIAMWLTILASYFLPLLFQVPAGYGIKLLYCVEQHDLWFPHSCPPFAVAQWHLVVGRSIKNGRLSLV